MRRLWAAAQQVWQCTDEYPDEVIGSVDGRPYTEAGGLGVDGRGYFIRLRSSVLMFAARVIAGFAAGLLSLSSPAHAWTRPGHMVTAAIAYDDLAPSDARVIERIGALLAQDPDRGAFEVAAGRAVGAERVRRLILECARWPDDARATPRPCAAVSHIAWSTPNVAVGARVSGQPAALAQATTHLADA